MTPSNRSDGNSNPPTKSLPEPAPKSPAKALPEPPAKALPEPPAKSRAALGAGAAAPMGTAMLEDLLNNTLDPGYQRAAENSSTHRGWERPASWLGCLAIGFVLVVAYQQSHRSAPARAEARKELVARILTVQSSGDRTDRAIKTLADQVSRLRDSQLSKTQTRVPVSEEVSSGVVAVAGRGIRVSLAEPQQNAGESAAVPGNLAPQIRDSDIRAVVNALWSAGAEAISVNGVRLTPVSSIRVAGESILVDFQPVSSPYSVEAIGDSNSLLVGFADSPSARALATRKAVNGISFSSQSERALKLAAGTTPALRYAERGVGATP